MLKTANKIWLDKNRRIKLKLNGNEKEMEKLIRNFLEQRGINIANVLRFYALKVYT